MSINFFKNNKVSNIQEIEWWLLKYSDQHKEIKKNWNCEYCPTEQELPCICENPSEKCMFLELYNKLEELTEYHRLEKYANEQLTEFKRTNYNQEKIKQWLIKNEKIASQDLACFLIDYLEYSENEVDNVNLLAYRNEAEKIEIFVNRQNFKNLIEFKELFDELYYVKKLYPEGLKRIERKMELIKTTANKELRQKPNKNGLN